jgi:predicted GNAT family acetyltransferase
MTHTVRDNAGAQRYEMDIGGRTAFISYRRAPGVVTLVHAEVPPELCRQGWGAQLARGALELVRGEGGKVVPRCPFIANYVETHPEFRDLLLDPH